MSSAVKLVGSALKVSVREVVFEPCDTPPTCAAPEKATGVGLLYTTAVRGDPEIAKPAGLFIATETVAPSATVIADIARLLALPVPVNAPLVAPVTVMSPAVKLVGSALKVSVSEVVSELFATPPTCATSEKVTTISGVGAGVSSGVATGLLQPISNSPEKTNRMPSNARALLNPEVFMAYIISFSIIIRKFFFSCPTNKSRRNNT
jgi:hypothetical protein